MTTTACKEPIISMPTGLLLAVVITAAAACAAASWAAAWLLGLEQGIGAAGVAGAGVVALVGSLGVVVMRPWKTRVMSEWATMWLAATVLRLLLTPVAAYVLYSAAPLSLTPLMLSVGGTYLVVLLVEAAFLALHLKRVA